MNSSWRFLWLAALVSAFCVVPLNASAEWTCTMNGKQYRVKSGCDYEPQLIWDSKCFEIWAAAQYHYCTLEEIGAASTSCTLDGKTIAHNGFIYAYKQAVVTAPAVCEQEKRYCVDGNLSGSYPNATCVVKPAPGSCPFNGQSIADGGFVYAYKAPQVVVPATCENEKRYCNGGQLSGTFKYATCEPVDAPSTCSFNGTTLQNGQSIKAYEKASVIAPATCESEIRKCSAGALSGSYDFKDCKVESTATATGTSTATATYSLLELAKKEQELARKRAIQLRSLLVKLREQNQQAAMFYKAQKNKGSDLTGLTEKADGGAYGAGSPHGDGKTSQKITNPFLKDKDKAGGLAGKTSKSGGSSSDISGTGAKLAGGGAGGKLAGGGGKGAPIDNPWVAYMADTVRVRLVEELRKSRSLRDELRKKIAEMPDEIEEEQESKAMLAEVLEEAEQKAVEKNLADDLTPLSPQEAFSMDAEETNRAIRELMAQLEANKFEAGLSLPDSLFDRVKRAHDRGAKRGAVRISRTKN